MTSVQYAPCDLCTAAASCRASLHAAGRRQTTERIFHRLDHRDKTDRSPSLGDRASDPAACCTGTLRIHRTDHALSEGHEL